MTGRTIVITSGKGGVGKTTATANIGTGLAMRGHRVVVVDTDIGLRNLDVIMGLEADDLGLRSAVTGATPVYLPIWNRADGNSRAMITALLSTEAPAWTHPLREPKTTMSPSARISAPGFTSANTTTSP